MWNAASGSWSAAYRFDPAGGTSMRGSPWPSAATTCFRSGRQVHATSAALPRSLRSRGRRHSRKSRDACGKTGRLCKFETPTRSSRPGSGRFPSSGDGASIPRSTATPSRSSSSSDARPSTPRRRRHSAKLMPGFATRPGRSSESSPTNRSPSPARRSSARTWSSDRARSCRAPRCAADRPRAARRHGARSSRWSTRGRWKSSRARFAVSALTKRCSCAGRAFAALGRRWFPAARRRDCRPAGSRYARAARASSSAGACVVSSLGAAVWSPSQRMARVQAPLATRASPPTTGAARSAASSSSGASQRMLRSQPTCATEA